MNQRLRTWGIALAAFLVAGLASAASAAPVTGHPRLLLRAEDLPRLRSWAVASNPIYQQGLAALAAQAVADMDAGRIMDGGGPTYELYPSEMYAELFAFMSLISSEPAATDYAQRARTLLMNVMNVAVLGQADGLPFRWPAFATSDRSRWWGEGFPLTVDWIYPSLSPADKASIRTVFLRWINENLNATTTNFNHPEPIGVVNDPQLISDPIAVRWSANNYYGAHMRNIGLMAMALDPADDPGNTLGNFLGDATGAWLYVVDHLLRTDSRGGLAPEGFEYGPQSMGYWLQFLLALRTAGQDDPGTWGPQVVLTGNPFWDDVVPAYLHSLSPVPLGGVFQPAWFGDAQTYRAPDFIGAFGPLGLYDYATGNALRLSALRWIEIFMAPGGLASLTDRARDGNFFFNGILYFMLFDPAGPVPLDARPYLPLTFFAPGLGRLRARTDWGPAATWFTYGLSWADIDHQTPDGNQFEFYRRGEWLTKQRTGYGLDFAGSDNDNTLTLENDPPAHNDPGDYRHLLWLRGSQWLVGLPSGDPQILARSDGPDYVYALGDATNLYNSTYEGSTDIQHASRSIVWLKPDHIVVYDRAESLTANRFKRFWLNLPAQAVVVGNQATMTTASGQRLFVTLLLPAGALITVPAPIGTPADQEPANFPLEVEAPGGPASARFLHVLQGADPGASADPVILVQSSAGTPYVGAVVKNTAVLFPVSLSTPFTSLTYSVPAGTTAHRITGLTPNARYDVTTQPVGDQVQVTISPGTAVPADGGGVLVQGSASNALAVSITANGTDFAPGQQLIVPVGASDPGIQQVVDFYVGVVFPDENTVACFTGPGLTVAIGSLANPATLTPFVSGFSLASPFTVSIPAFLVYTWTGSEPFGNYTLFLAAVVSGALADNTIGAQDVVSLSTWTFNFHP